MTPQILERHVLAKPYFDRLGLIIAEQQGECVGFVHAGCGPSPLNDGISFETAAIHGIFVAPGDESEWIADQLLHAAEAYLTQRGTRQIQAGGWFPVIPFYLGFYGGSRLPGIMADDSVQLARFARAGYLEKTRTTILQIEATNFRPPVTRQQMTNRRTHQVIASFDPQSDSWWEACTLGWAERVRFSLLDKVSGGLYGQVMFWDMEPLSGSWGVRCMGLYDLNIDNRKRREGRATYLVGEAIRQLGSQGVRIVEVQVPSSDLASLTLFHKLGFQPQGEGIRLEKAIGQ